MTLRICFILLLFTSSICIADSTYVFPSQIQEDDVEPDPIANNTTDPHESFNRKIFAFNTYLEKIILRPITTTYIKIFPTKVHNGISNIISNFSLPVNFVNSIFIGKIENATNLFWKFTLNSTFGVGGFYNFSNKIRLETNDYNFADTLAYYKFSEGAYLVLPLFGPSTYRDAFGTITDIIIDPNNYIFTEEFNTTRKGIEIIDKYSNKIKYIDEIQNKSLDPYITIRSLYMQNKIYKNTNK